MAASIAADERPVPGVSPGLRNTTPGAASRTNVFSSSSNGNPQLAVALLQRLSERPPLFEAGEELFWDDPHISGQMLAAHLDPELEAASRPPQVIDRTVAWLAEVMGLRPGDRLLDLGCGPGLYCTRFAERGLRVTGVDYSRRSIQYAREYAGAHVPPGSVPIDYLCEDYTGVDTSPYEGHFRAATMIYGDICVLNDRARDRVLANVYTMLEPGGMFAFDVTTPTHHDRYGPSRSWSVQMGGFWKPGPYLVLEQLFDYPEHTDADVYLRRYLVIEEGGGVSDYRIWTRLYTVESMGPVLRRAGFELAGVWGDLTGSPYDASSEWLGFLVRK